MNKFNRKSIIIISAVILLAAFAVAMTACSSTGKASEKTDLFSQYQISEVAPREKADTSPEFDEALRTFAAKLLDAQLQSGKVTNFCIPSAGIYQALTAVFENSGENPDALGKLYPEDSTLYLAWLIADDRPGIKLSCTEYASPWAFGTMFKGGVSDGSFTREDGSTQTVKYMRDGKTYGCRGLKGDKFLRLTLPLAEGNVFLILPDENCTVRDIDPTEALPEPGSIQDEYDYYDLKLPVIDQPAVPQLSGILSGLEVSGVTLSDDLQNAVFRLDTKGISSTAAMTTPFIGENDAISEPLTFDRPFIYGVADSAGRIIYVGVFAGEN